MNEDKTQFPFADYEGLSRELELESIRYSRRLDEEEEAV